MDGAIGVCASVGGMRMFHEARVDGRWSEVDGWEVRWKVPRGVYEFYECYECLRDVIAHSWFTMIFLWRRSRSSLANGVLGRLDQGS
jgi:hypothetical protein